MMKTPAKSKIPSKGGKVTQASAAKVKIDSARPVAQREQAEVTPVQSSDSSEQSKFYEKATRHFHAMEFGKAKGLFDKASVGPLLEMAHAARLHARMCEQRLAKAAPTLKDPEDYYNYGVALINRGELDAAEEYLRRALSHDPAADHIYYALALCRGLKGDFAGASAHLKRAIELQPRNRIVARNDPDFAEISHHPGLRELLF